MRIFWGVVAGGLAHLAVAAASAGDRAYEMYDPMGGETAGEASEATPVEGHSSSRIGAAAAKTKAAGGAIGSAARKAVGATYDKTTSWTKTRAEGVTAATAKRKKPAVPSFYASAGFYLNPELDFAYPTGGGQAVYDFDRDLGLEGSVGTHYRGLRLELTVFRQSREPSELTFLGSSLPTDGGIDTWGLLLGGYWDALPDYKVSPYLGGALGFAKTVYDIESSGISLIDDDTFHLAWRGTAGATMRVNQRLEAYGEARYIRLGEHELHTAGGANAKIEMNGLAYGAGFRLDF